MSDRSGSARRSVRLLQSLFFYLYFMVAANDRRSCCTFFRIVLKLIRKVCHFRIGIQPTRVYYHTRHPHLSFYAGMQCTVRKIKIHIPHIGKCTKLLVPCTVLIYIQNISVLFCQFFQRIQIPSLIQINITFLPVDRRRCTENNANVRVDPAQLFYNCFHILAVQFFCDHKPCAVDLVIRIFIRIHVICSKHNKYYIRTILFCTLIKMFQYPCRIRSGYSCIDHDIVCSMQVLFYIFFKRLRRRIVSFRMYKSMRNRVSQKQPRQWFFVFHLIGDLLLNGI